MIVSGTLIVLIVCDWIENAHALCVSVIKFSYYPCMALYVFQLFCCPPSDNKISS